MSLVRQLVVCISSLISDLIDHVALGGSFNIDAILMGPYGWCVCSRMAEKVLHHANFHRVRQSLS